jgi:hypothetical protein
VKTTTLAGDVSGEADVQGRMMNGRAADRQPAVMTTGEVELYGGAAHSAMEPEALSGSWLHAGALSP